MQTTLKKPIITEKSMKAVAMNRYTFEVPRLASKGQIKKAVEDIFSVEVIKVRTIRLARKRRRVGKTRREIRGPIKKKAIVEIKEGQKIDVFESQS